jgi:glucose-6-phosphate 1-dehydrogenase
MLPLRAFRHPEVTEDLAADIFGRIRCTAPSMTAAYSGREDYVEAAWPIVDPVLKADTAVYSIYAPNTWRTSEVDQKVLHTEQNPILTD